MDKIVKTIGGGIKRTIDTIIGNESNTKVEKDDAYESEDTNAHSTHETSPASPESQPQSKRARTQHDTEFRQIASRRHPEERPRARQPHTRSSPHQERVASSRDRPERQPRAGQPSASQKRSSSPSEHSERQYRAAKFHGQSSAGESFESNQRGTNQGKKPSADERVLVPETYPYATSTVTPEPQQLASPSQTEDSTPILVPKNDWTSSNMSQKRKPGGSGFKPGNSLNRPGAGANPLLTYSSRGINVSGSPAKRQKTSHEVSPDPDDLYFNRDLQEQSSATLARRPSVISVNSQSQETPSQRANAFQHNESRNVHGILNGIKKKGRKSKASTMQPSSHFPYGTHNDHDDDDDVQFVDAQPVSRQTANQSTRRLNPSSSLPDQVQPNSPKAATEVDSAWHRSHRADLARESALKPNRVEIPVLSTTTSGAPRKRAQSPGMGDTFVRDQGEPQSSPAAHQNQAKIKEKMQATSNTTRTVQLRPAVEELSEDELSREHTSPQTTRRSRRTTRSPSPNAITSTHFTKRSKKADVPESTMIQLSSLRMSAGSWDGEMLYLISPPGHKIIQFHYKGEFLMLGKSPIKLTGVHATRVFCSNGYSSAMILTGATDQQSRGKVWFDFFTREDRDEFERLVRQMNAKISFTTLDDDRFEAFCKNAEPFFQPKPAMDDPKLQATEHLRDTVSKPMTERERNLAIQKGTPLSEPENVSQTPRKTRMKENFTNRTAGSSALDYSLPPPTARTERATTTRSSQRLQIKVGGKATQSPEPELQKWTRVNGIPPWDGPLTYPFTGSNRTTVEAEDIARLDDGELLNDNIISFCLRDMEESNPELKDKAHIFNSFFYESLTTLGSGKKGFNYDAVRRWTRTKDLFSLPFVAVPINTSLHWFLVIICNLDQLNRKLSLDGLEDNREEEPDVKSLLTAQEPIQSQSTAQNDMEIPESPQESKDGDLSQGVKRISLDASQDQEDEVPAASKLKPTPRKGKRQGLPPQKLDPTTPALLLLDSLGGSHPQEIRNLKQYAVHEGRDKRGLEFEYTELKGVNARGLPQQTNFCDCGVYLIGYMEAFLRDPQGFARKVMSRELDHNNDFADFDPSKKRAEIRERLLKLHEEQTLDKKRKRKQAHLAKLEAKRKSETRSAAVTPAQMSSPMKPPAAYNNPRMVQSSPMKPPPKQMQRSSPPVPSSSRRAPPTSDRDADEDMLFDQAYENGNYNSTSTAPDSRDSYSHAQYGSSHDQPSNIRFRPSFVDELQKAIQEAGQVEQDEE